MNKKYKLTRNYNIVTIIQKLDQEVIKIKEEKPEAYGDIEEFLEEYRKFLNDTASEDVLQIILRSHLYIEQEITQLLKIYLKEPDVFFYSRPMFTNKLNLSVALGLIPKEDKPAYDKLNKIRNGYAHNLNYQCTDQDIEEIIHLFHGDLKKYFEMLLSKTEKINIRSVLALMWINLRFKVNKLPATLELKEIQIRLAELREEKEKIEKSIEK